MSNTLPSRFSSTLRKSTQFTDQFLQVGTNSDIIRRPFRSMGREGMLYYLDGMTASIHVAQHVLRPLLESRSLPAGTSADQYAAQELINAPQTQLEEDPRQAIPQVLQGQCLILLEGCSRAIVVDMRFFVHRAVNKPVNEQVIIGSHEAFNESLRDNLTLLHRRLKTEKLICSIKTVGTAYPGTAAIVYLEGVCPASTVEALTGRLQGAAVDTVSSIGELQQLLEDSPNAPLPQAAMTERPDRVISFLLEGQAAVLLDGSPRALVMPVSLWHLCHAPDDSNMRWIYGSAMRLLRLIGAVAALLAPALLVCLYTFHPALLPMTLLTSIMQSRTVLPISLYGEAALLLIIFDLINESGTRAPELMGSSLGLVSTLILGTAAVEAKLVSPLLLIMVALSGLGSFALPDYALAFSFRIIQLGLVLIAGITGAGGLCAALLLLSCWIGGMESLGSPYLAPAFPSRMHNPDLILRRPIYRQRLRGNLAQMFHVKRARGRMRRFPGKK